jgi:peptidoglycan/xylan/chitin deacetylase (PgdA/CDA1 family)
VHAQLQTPNAKLQTAARAPTRARRLPALLIIALVAKLVGVTLGFVSSHRGAAAISFFAPDPFLLYALFVPSGQGLCRVFTHFTTDQREIWLTIDDGPDPQDTPQILDLLDRHNARATFFVIGERAARWPELLIEITRRGHEIAHHTHTHPARTLWCASTLRLAAELDRPLQLFRSLGIAVRFFRAPVGIKHLLLAPLLAQRSLDYLGWSIRSGDCHAPSIDAIADGIIRQLHPGAIVLLHEGASVPARFRVAAVARLLEAVAHNGYACVIPDRRQLR